MYTYDWQKSSYSAQGNNCLEIAAARAADVHMRESDEPELVLTTSATRLSALLRTAKRGALSYHPPAP